MAPLLSERLLSRSTDTLRKGLGVLKLGNRG